MRLWPSPVARLREREKDSSLEGEIGERAIAANNHLVTECRDGHRVSFVIERYRGVLYALRDDPLAPARLEPPEGGVHDVERRARGDRCLAELLQVQRFRRREVRTLGQIGEKSGQRAIEKCGASYHVTLSDDPAHFARASPLA